MTSPRPVPVAASRTTTSSRTTSDDDAARAVRLPTTSNGALP